MTRTRMGLVLGLLPALALAIAACGGGGGKSNGVASLGGDGKATATTAAGGSGRMQQALAYARCMRQHGIDVPDPQLSGDMILQDLGDNDENDPKFRAANQACRQHQPGGDQAQRPNPQQQQRMLAFARCMRRHGINLPDPQISGNDITQQLPRGLDPDNPKLRAAQQACHQYGSLPPSNGPQRGGDGK